MGNTTIRFWKVYTLCHYFPWKWILMYGILLNFVWNNLNYKCYTTTDTYWYCIFWIVQSMVQIHFCYISFCHFIVERTPGLWLNQHEKATNIFVCQWCVLQFLWHTKMSDKGVWGHTSHKGERKNKNRD